MALKILSSATDVNLHPIDRRYHQLGVSKSTLCGSGFCVRIRILRNNSNSFRKIFRVKRNCNRQKCTDLVHFPCGKGTGIFLTLKDLLFPMGGLLWKFLILFGFMLYCFCFRVLVGFMSSSVSTFLEMMRIRFWRNSPCVENKNRKAFLWMKFFYDVDTATPMENFMM